jgi:hypothetical protein
MAPAEATGEGETRPGGLEGGPWVAPTFNA